MIVMQTPLYISSLGGHRLPVIFSYRRRSPRLTRWVLMDVSHSLNAMGTEVCYDGWVAENTWSTRRTKRNDENESRPAIWFDLDLS